MCSSTPFKIRDPLTNSFEFVVALYFASKPGSLDVLFSPVTVRGAQLLDGTRPSEADYLITERIFYSFTGNCDFVGSDYFYVAGVATAEKVAPAAVTNLAGVPAQPDAIALNWNEPGDDVSSGIIFGYDVRYSTVRPITEEDWASATPVGNSPSPVGPDGLQNFLVTGLACNTKYYFAIKAFDEVPNFSFISNSPDATTLACSSLASGALDLAAPRIQVTSHLNQQVVSGRNITIIGTVTDSGLGDSGTSSVTVNGVMASGGVAVGANTASWVALISLVPGPNIVTVAAKDGSMNQNGAVTEIVLNYQPPTIFIDDAVGFEGSLTITFDIRLSKPSTDAVAVSFTTVDGVATAGPDYIPTSGAVSFAPGETVKTAVVQIKSNATIQGNRSFAVDLFNPTNGVLNAVDGGPFDSRGIGTIVDDDAAGIASVACPTSSLQAAIDLAKPGQTLSVIGQCNENIIIRNEKQRLTIDGNGVAVIKGSNHSLPVVNIRGKGIALQNFEITGGADGVSINRGSTAVINNNFIHGASANGVVVEQLGYAVITNNIITNNLAAGIWVRGSSSARIGFNADSESQAAANIIEGNGAGIFVNSESSARIVGNSINGNSGDGIAVFIASQSDIASNTIQSNGFAGIYVGDNSVIQLGEDAGTSIFANPNQSGGKNGLYGIECANGSLIDGRLGTLNGNLGIKSIDANCLDSLIP
jgi:parallel beta-helix repeat protein